MKSFTVQGVTPSQNKVDRMHWTERSQLKDEWYWLTKAAAGVSNEPEQRPVALHIVRVSRRLIDDANVPSGCKYLIDALVSFGWAKDDSRKHMRATFDQKKCDPGEEPHMKVTIEPLNDTP